MTFSKGISFPMNPTKKDIKELRKQVAYDKFKVVDGGQAKKPAGGNKAKPADSKNRDA